MRAFDGQIQPIRRCGRGFGSSPESLENRSPSVRPARGMDRACLRIRGPEFEALCRIHRDCPEPLAYGASPSLLVEVVVDLHFPFPSGETRLQWAPAAIYGSSRCKN